MRQLALSAVGRDRPGIVAAVSERLLAHGVNVEDSQMAILRGHFAMMLIVSAPDGLDVAALRTDLDEVRGSLNLEGMSVSEVDDAPRQPAPSHVVTVYGADHPGIVYAISSALAAAGASITDLTTRVVSSGEAPVYVMIMEAALDDDAAKALEGDLADVARSEGLEVTVRPLEHDAL